MTKKNLQSELDEANDRLAVMTDYAAEADGLIATLVLELAKVSFESMVLGDVLEVTLGELRLVQDEKARVAQIAKRRAEAEKLPSIAKWALAEQVVVLSDGMLIKFIPMRHGREVNSKSEIDYNGNVSMTTTELTGEAQIEFNLPIFGKMTVMGDLKHTEVTFAGDSWIDITNVATFSLDIQGYTRKVMITSRGEINTDSGFGYQCGCELRVSPTPCNNCGRMHGSKTYVGDVVVN